jgi:5-methylcytosine-specific restriction enzyme A
VISKNYTARSTRARRLKDEELRQKSLDTGKTQVGKRVVSVIEYQRSPFVAEDAKRRAKGICELCRQPAPFQKKNGEPYLETHHIVWLAKGGADTVENTVALCPNCHKKMHSLNLQSDVNLLREAIK